jgi:predicted butyrate kinase (DUF1464 family)
MPRVVGIDPGTLSIDLFGLDDGAPFLERSFPTPDVARDPGPLVAALEAARPLDLVAGPSGYGLPLVPIERVGPAEERLLFLPDGRGRSPLGGLVALARRLAQARLPVVFLPGVVHLASVPAHRKLNRVDLGTADKLCAAAFAIDDQARRGSLALRDTSFVLVEMGAAFTAVLSVAGGRIVSGQGGSAGPIGLRGPGALDGEVACLLRDVSKSAVFTGGVAFAAGAADASPEALATLDTPAARVAREALLEGVVRSVAGEIAAVGTPREVLLSGRLARVPAFADPVAERLSRFAPVRRLEPGTVKEAARGAALLADGLAGGRHEGLVDAIGLREASGSVFDHLHIEGARRAAAWNAAS